MKKNLIYVGVDVDDNAFHFAGVSCEGEVLFKNKKALPSAGSLLKEIKVWCKNSPFKIGYEATYLGYSLARDIKKLGFHCEIIAPTSIKKAPNETVKTDRKDSLNLALGMWRREFSYVQIPTYEQESDRQLLRVRSFLVSQRSDLKRNILSQCRLLNLNFKAETGLKEYWTLKFRNWLDKKIQALPASMQVGFSCLIQNLENLNRQISTLESEIEYMASKEQYKKVSSYLCAFKGVEKITAMTIVTEIFDIERFKHPKQLVAYIGFDIREYSSGGKQRQFSISKMGNCRLRTALVEACQKFATSKTPSKRKQKSRIGCSKEAIEIADRCQERLYKKGHRLLAREKPRSKVKVACAREMVGFIWEAMRKAA